MIGLRTTVASLLVLAIFAALGARLYRIQCVEHAAFLEQRNMQSISVETVCGRRGSIFDRNGRVLALSRKVNSVFAVPGEVEDHEATANALAGVLGTDAEAIRKKFKAAPGESPRCFVWIKRKVTQEQADKVAALNLQGVDFRQEYKRSYPLGKMASHVLGFANIDELGMEGVEAVCDRLLRGHPGSYMVLRDALGRKIMPPNGSMPFDPATDGLDIFLTLDVVIQQILEEELDALRMKWNPAGVTGIVIDPYTGDILALANRPDFDPNDPGAYPEASHRNRALTDPFEPGSTFKPFVMGPVLQEGVVSLTDHVNCENGVFRYRGRTLRDAHANGVLTVEEVLTKSSNIGMAKLGLLLVDARGKLVMRNYLVSFDFGARTASGLVPTMAESPGKVTTLADWSYYTTTSVPMGHEISVTALQLLKAYGALANGGKLVRPRILLSVAESSGGFRMPPGSSASPEVIREVLGPRAVEKLRGALRNVVVKGTGTKAAVSCYEVAGKTGTAQKLLPDGQYASNKHLGAFVGFAPADKPRVAVIVVVDEPKDAYYGGTVAAPSVGRVIERSLQYLGVRSQNVAGAKTQYAEGR
jgi:cell division protein FtsI (penicillin-binding protein 3)